MGAHHRVRIAKWRPVKACAQKQLVVQYGHRVKNAIYPVPLYSLWLALAAAAGLHAVYGAGYMYGVVDACSDALLKPVVRYSAASKLLSVLVLTALQWLVFVQLVRALCRWALSYRGFLYESMGKTSLRTKMFMVFIQLLWKAKPSFFSFQGILPSRPLPSIRETTQKYLQSMRPLLDDEQYGRVAQMADDFEQGVANSLQRRLWLKWLTSPTYVDGWWKEFAYLRNNHSLLRTSVAGIDVLWARRTHIQAARAANLTVLRRTFMRDTVERQCMKPLTMGGVPMCSKQYYDALRTIRVPGENGDTTKELCADPRHCVVFHRGCWYKVATFHGRRMLRPAELERAFQSIIDNADNVRPQRGEKLLSALTAGRRERWAAAKAEHLSNGVNKVSLDTIENAHEVLFLDEEDAHYDDDDMSQIEAHYRRTLTGYGYQLWLDHPETLIVSRNGKMCSNGEHSVADALIFCHMIEYFKYHESFTPHHQYTEGGHAKGAVEHVPKPERLQFDIDDECESMINESYKEAARVAADFNNAALIYDKYGKTYMKSIGVSPDAFIQMALQLAYLRDQGKFGLTYEAALMRLYKHGRTETVRTVTELSCKFARDMDDNSISREDKLAALVAACNAHQGSIRDAMSGKAADRHLFALYVVSRYLNVESPFLEHALNEPWLLSTSQTAQHQHADYMKALNGRRDLLWPAGAFQAPANCHYGVSYTIAATGDVVCFHASAWQHHENTDATRFREVIRRALDDMRTLAPHK